MPTVETISSRPDAQRHVEVALSLVPETKSKLAHLPSHPAVTPLRPVKWSEFATDWLDTPAAHCSPLDDY